MFFFILQERLEGVEKRRRLEAQGHQADIKRLRNNFHICVKMREHLCNRRLTQLDPFSHIIEKKIVFIPPILAQTIYIEYCFLK